MLLVSNGYDALTRTDEDRRLQYFLSGARICARKAEYLKNPTYGWQILHVSGGMRGFACDISYEK